MFNRLDTNYDLLLDQSELGSIYLDKNEQCTKAFFNSCDTYKDSLISNNEWCYCFQRQQDPPCQTELSNIQKQQGGKKLLDDEDDDMMNDEDEIEDDDEDEGDDDDDDDHEGYI
ncbi:hypothetical protein JD844_026917 [Phrynosoma platyrhinos]|uniref:SPARC/Testican calcium-binding domain-containing protein n=1 Tax=Phrynosoma platyrhinos TaxID=52577 RepID=A0ABQ7SFH6_PHRPL|nr:hypothetical protein JD844_026917 [Phrynosoma platyrhinos]